MTAEIIRNRIDERCTHFTFEYNNMACGVDPIYYPNIGQTFEMWYGETDYIAYTVEEVMTIRLFNGKCLNEIADEIDIIDF